MSEATKEQQKPEGKGVDIPALLDERLSRIDCLANVFEPLSKQAVHVLVFSALVAVTRQRLAKMYDPVEDNLVIAEIRDALKKRAEMGRQKYGETLHSWNGRDAQLDLWQELLDAYQYSGQDVVEEQSR